MSTNRALVTGGAGFIGSTVVDALVDDGAEVLVVDDLSRGSLDNLKGSGRSAHFADIDIRDAQDLHRTVLRFRPEVVFHLAAQIDVRSSMEDPGQDAWRNIVGSVNVFSAASAAGVRRVVNTSTGGAIYARDSPVPTPESAVCEPESAYGLGKRTVEMYAEWFHRAKGLDVLTLRYGNVYGERQDPAGDAGVVALFCACALSGRRPTIFGDGLQTRDFVYVGDVAAANLAAAAAERPRRSVYNIGTGTEITIRELVQVVAHVADVPSGRMEPRLAPPRAGEVLRSCLDVREATLDLQLGRTTPLADGLRRTLAWIRSI